MTHLPWYHYRWPWVLMLVPFAAVLFGIFMVVTAMLYPDDVVVDTYYRDGQAINQLRALDEAAQALGLTATLTVTAQEGRSSLFLTGTDEASLQLFVYHVTDSAADRRIDLTASGSREYVSTDATLSALLSSPGVWYLELRGTDNDWRLRKRVQTPIETVEF